MTTDNLDAAPVAGSALGLSVPVIDLREPRTLVVDEIAAACAAWGFFQIIGHGVDAAVVERATEATRAFFAAPKADKRALSRSRENPWGFYDRELTKNARDKKEIFDIGPDAGGALVEGPFSGATPWPSWRPGFEPAMRAYFAACAEASARLMSLVYEGLGAPVSGLRDAFGTDHASFLRLNYYPVDDPLAGEVGDRADLGIHHHTDAGALTLLLQDDVSGLQVYRDGLWHDVRPLAGAFVINIGDMVQVWSNDRYRAPVHRVLAMERVERRSLPFFFNPAYRAVIAPLDSVVDSKHPAHYAPISWSEFRRRRADGDFANYGAEVQIADYRL
ncbi:MAG TPA: 2OG-Fe(II) oxygenase family protein [Kofleriaceae bacterium]|nr:2OG-Fe(II) oxygenase family protein [Kofleriaceae bacterium]